MKLFIFACLIAALLSAVQSDEQQENFQAFKVKYNKSYRNQAEETKRFNIFKDNIQDIELHNVLYEQNLVSYKQGINKFTDITHDEFKAMLSLSSSNKPHFNTTLHLKTGLAIPDSVDWRAEGQVTEIKDQASCGGCWAFSITGSTEAAYFRKSGKLVSFSEQQLIDCTTGMNYGCEGGFIDITFSYVQDQGIQSEDSYPFTGTDGTCSYSSSKVVTKISSYKAITPEDEDSLLDAVANVGPVSIAMNALYLSSYESGIYEDSRCAGMLDHAILVVGYGIENGKKIWIVKNSWGLQWGEQGYFRIVRGKNECGLAEDMVYPTCQ